jgi:hypothetical protein
MFEWFYNDSSCWLLVAGCWLLVAGCWLLVAGCWLLVAGCWLLALPSEALAKEGYFSDSSVTQTS